MERGNQEREEELTDMSPGTRERRMSKSMKKKEVGSEDPDGKSL